MGYCCRLQAKAVLHNESVSQVQTLLALLEAVMLTLAPQPEARTALAYERQFVYCLAWSIGGLLDPADRRLFDAHLRSFKRDAMPQATLNPISVDTRVFTQPPDEKSGKLAKGSTCPRRSSHGLVGTLGAILLFGDQSEQAEPSLVRKPLHHICLTE
jgi:hypothetical protein